MIFCTNSILSHCSQSKAGNVTIVNGNNFAVLAFIVLISSK